jgi:Tfp pilus assembly protein PilE
MRMIFSLIGLLIVVAIVGILTKSQLSSVTQLPNSTASSGNAGAAPANIAEQSKQMQAQVKDQVNEAMKAAADAQKKALDSANSDKNADKASEKTGSAY